MNNAFNKHEKTSHCQMQAIKGVCETNAENTARLEAPEDLSAFGGWYLGVCLRGFVA